MCTCDVRRITTMTLLGARCHPAARAACCVLRAAGVHKANVVIAVMCELLTCVV